MTNENQCFHPRLLIADHFDLIINQIDIKTESLLCDQSLLEETRNKLNEIRETQIEKLNELKELNLKHLKSKEEEFSEKWSLVKNDSSLEYKHKIDKIKEELIVEDCVLLENPNEINCFNLWITSWFHNEKDLKFLR